MTAWLLAIAMVIAMIRRVEVYTAFTAGAREGMETAMRILPGLAAIFVALRMLEASGLMHALCGALAPVAAWLGLPEGVMPLLLLPGRARTRAAAAREPTRLTSLFVLMSFV